MKEMLPPLRLNELLGCPFDCSVQDTSMLRFDTHLHQKPPVTFTVAVTVIETGIIPRQLTVRVIIGGKNVETVSQVQPGGHIAVAHTRAFRFVSHRIALTLANATAAKTTY